MMITLSTWSKRLLNHLHFHTDGPYVSELIEGMATLLSSGVPLPVALRCLESSTTSNRIRGVWLSSALASVQVGAPLSTVWRDCAPDILYALMVAGERSGSLPDALKLWLTYDQRQRQLRHEFTKSSAYPLLVLTGIVGVLVLLFRVVMPSLATMYNQLGIAISGETQLLFSAVAVMPDVATSLVFCLIVVLVTAALIARNRPDLWARVSLRLPGYRLIMMYRTERLCSLFHLLLSAGIALNDATRLVQRESQPGWLKDAARTMHDRVLSGQPLTSVFAGPWDNTLLTMVQWAEETGDLSGALHRSAQYVQLRLQHKLTWLMQLYGPLLLLLLGVSVAATMAMVFVPLYSLMNAMGGLHPAQ